MGISVGEGEGRREVLISRIHQPWSNVRVLILNRINEVLDGRVHVC